MNPVTTIDNNRASFIFLPPIAPDWLQGIALKPGRNEVPNKYLEALFATKNGRKNFDALKEPVRIFSHDAHEVFRPQILVYEEGQAQPDDHVATAPISLEGYSDAAALELIKVENNKQVLTTWLKNTRKVDLKTAITAKLKG